MIKIHTTNCGIKYKNRDDLLLVTFDAAVNVAGVFTQSTMPAFPVTWCKKNVTQGKARALLVNAGNANAFTGKYGEEVVSSNVSEVVKHLGCKAEEVFVASTGVIGEKLKYELINNSVAKFFAENSANSSWEDAAKAIMTTDLKPKLVKKSCKIGDKKIELVGFAKGSGMIAPNMATTLGFTFTDADIPSEILSQILKEATQDSFNSITVDSDQSTNDTFLVFATGEAQNQKITSFDDAALNEFKTTLLELLTDLAKMIVIDGEGAQKLIEIEVTGVKTKADARKVAFSIANSPLVKTALAAADPNWGRIIMAVGKSEVATSPEKIILKIGDYQITENGAVCESYVEKEVHEYLKNSEVKIFVDLGMEPLTSAASATVWTCDFNEEYVKINKDYRS